MSAKGTPAARSSSRFEKAERALLEQRRGLFVVVGHAVVGEQVPLAGVEEKLCARRLDELAGGGEVLLGPLVALHHVDLERDAVRPGAAELGGRHGAVEEEGSRRAGASLSQLLSRHDT